MSLTPRIDAIEDDNAKVGDVVMSMLDEATFQTQRSAKWVLMDGRAVTGSDYEAVTGNTNIPDGRGRFPRMKDNGAGVAPTEEALGALQSDSFASHNHGGGSHTHNYFRPNANRAGNPSGTRRVEETGGTSATTGPSTTVVQTQGGAETRPVNVTLNFFIKINE